MADTKPYRTIRLLLGGLRMYEGASQVRAFIQSLAKDVLFTRRQLIQRSLSRGVVDNELSRLIDKGVIARVATGVYLHLSSQVQIPQARKIAEARAGAFCKQILDSARVEPPTNTFFTDGCPTSFNSIHGRVGLKSIAPSAATKPLLSASGQTPIELAPQRLCPRCAQSQQREIKGKGGSLLTLLGNLFCRAGLRLSTVSESVRASFRKAS